MPTITTVIPVYATPQNGRLDYLAYTIRSGLRQQTHSTLVFLVVDDGSTADVEAAVKEFKDSRLRYLKRERKSDDLPTPSNPLNYGIESLLQQKSEVLTMSESC